MPSPHRSEGHRHLARGDSHPHLESVDRQLLTEQGHRRDEIEPGPDGALRVVLVRIGTPQTAKTASPMNFSTVPPYRSTIERARSK